MSRVHVIKSVGELQNHRSSGKSIVLMLSGKQCGPCRNIMPRVEQLAQQNPNILFLKAWCDEVPALFRGVSMPTFNFYLSGNRVYQFTGANVNQLVSAVGLLVKKTQASNSNDNNSEI